MVLDDEGLVVTLAVDGREAIALLAAQPFDDVLIDCEMPGMEGYEATRAIREPAAWRELPIIAMTANAMSGGREKAIDAGMNDHIANPLDGDAMFKAIARWIGRAVRTDARRAPR